MTIPIGSILDGLGVTADIEDTDLVESAVVVMSVLVPDSHSPRLVIANSRHLSWITQAGLVRLAERIVTDPPPDPEYDEDD